MTDQAIAIRDAESMRITRAPEEVLAEAQRAAKALKGVLDAKARKVIINGEPYLELEDWSTVASFYRVAGGAEDAVPCEVDGIKGAKAKGYVVDVNTGVRISSADAYCLRDEDQWEDKPWFQLASMAQTRAVAKALRFVLSRVVVLAGYKPTPAEEMGATRSGGRPVVFPFGKHKDAEPSSLDLADLHKELAFWQEKAAKEQNERFRANNERLVKAIQEAIAEKSAKTESPAGAPEPRVTGDELASSSPPAGDLPTVDAWKARYEVAHTTKDWEALESELKPLWSKYAGEEQTALKFIRDKAKQTVKALV